MSMYLDIASSSMREMYRRAVLIQESIVPPSVSCQFFKNLAKFAENRQFWELFCDYPQYLKSTPIEFFYVTSCYEF